MKAHIRRMTIIQLVTLVFLVGGARAAPDEFMFVSENAVYDPTTQVVDFTVTFNQPPDFATVDAVGRQADSFQYFIVGDAQQPYPATYDAIIRGEELHLAPETLRIRNATPSVSDPVAGGWGSLRGVVPSTVKGAVLTFSVPLHVLTTHSHDGLFTYTLPVRSFQNQFQRFGPPEKENEPKFWQKLPLKADS